MAADFLEVQKQIENVKNYKRELEEQLKQSEKQMEEVAAKSDNEEARKFVQLQKEKVNISIDYFEWSPARNEVDRSSELRILE